MSSEFTKWLRDLWRTSLQASSNVNFVNRPFDLALFTKYSPTFIETGSAKGDGIQRALDAGFSTVISIELDEDLYLYCKTKFHRNKKVHVYHGYSHEVLPQVLKERSVIFLDAHPAGPNTAGHDQLMKGDLSVGQDAILKKELQVILSHRTDHLIFLDDQNGTNQPDFKEMILAANPDYSFRFFDQVFAGNYYREKILGCLPVLLRDH